MKISVIMPLYNAEKFLEESLNSVLEQKIQDLELLCIDDASTDFTLQILEKYCQEDKRIRLISNEKHMGAALSRNRGMMEATGEYIAFLDGDDIFEKDMLSEAYDAAVKYDADIVEYPYKVFPSDRIREKTNILHSDVYKMKFCQGVFSVQQIQPYEFMNCHAGPCTRIYRRKLVEKEKLEFQDLPCSNDVFFVNMALFLADSIHFLDNEKVMLHVRNHNTPSRISYRRDPMCAFAADKKTAEELVVRGRMEKVCRQFYYRVYCHLLITLKSIKEKEMAKQFYSFLSKDGINELVEIGKEYFQQLDNYTQKGLERFQKETFESGWFEEAGELESYLYENSERIRELFSAWEVSHMKIGLWGVGQNGRIFLKFCRENRYDIAAVIDKDKQKRGEIIQGYTPVCMPEEICNQLQIIILTSSNLVSEVSKIIKDNKWKLQICDINMYLGR